MVRFYYDDNIELLSNTIHENTKYLVFGDKFNQKVDILPKSILQLKFGHNFNQSVDMLPPLIYSLAFGHNFNQSVDMLPQLIDELIFGYNFNQSVNMLPASITSLIFGYSFNQSVNMLHPSIIFLRFYNKCLLKILYVSNRAHIFYTNYGDGGYALTKAKCIENENMSFCKHKITFEMIYKNGNRLFYNIKKIPYGCVYDSIVYI